MPEPNTHAALGVGAGYLVGTIAQLNPDFLVIGAVSALIAAGRKPPPESIGLSRQRQMIMALCNISGVSLFSAGGTKLALLAMPAWASGGIAIAAMLGFFGVPLIASLTEIIGKGWQLIASKIGAGNVS